MKIEKETDVMVNSSNQSITKEELTNAIYKYVKASMGVEGIKEGIIFQLYTENMINDIGYLSNNPTFFYSLNEINDTDNDIIDVIYIERLNQIKKVYLELAKRKRLRNKKELKVRKFWYDEFDKIQIYGTSSITLN